MAESSVLSWNRYGKSRIRLVKVRRAADRHDVVDLTVDIQLEGAFEPVYTDGDNTSCLATDTMKNTVYAFARRDPIEHVEAFALRLADHFIATPPVDSVRIAIAEDRWDRLSSGGAAHPHAFAKGGGEQWTAEIRRDRHGARVAAGLTNLLVMKTANSAFAGFPRDGFTTLPETEDRILATSITASWQYRDGMRDFGAREAIRSALLAAFAAHDSRSVQHTLYAIGEAALAACAEVTEITLALPNRHHLLVDLSPFGLDNPNEIFVATDQPFGLIEATVKRTTVSTPEHQERRGR
jgi:urate oxidase